MYSCVRAILFLKEIDMAEDMITASSEQGPVIVHAPEGLKEVVDEKLEKGEPLTVKDVCVLVNEHPTQNEKDPTVWDLVHKTLITPEFVSKEVWDSLDVASWIYVSEEQFSTTKDFLTYLSNEPMWKTQQTSIKATLLDMNNQKVLQRRFDKGEILNVAEFEYWLNMMSRGISPDLVVVDDEEVQKSKELLFIQMQSEILRDLVRSRMEKVQKYGRQHPYVDTFGNNSGSFKNRYVEVLGNSFTNFITQRGLETPYGNE